MRHRSHKSLTVHLPAVYFGSAAGARLSLGLLVVCFAVTIVPTPSHAADEKPEPSPIAKLEGASGNQALFSEDGARLLTADENEARVWDARTFRPITAPIRWGERIRASTMSDDGKWLAACFANSAGVYQIDADRRLPVMRHPDEVLAVSFSPNGEMLATAGLDKTARVWSVRNGALIQALEHPNPVVSVTFSPDGLRLLTSTLSREALALGQNSLEAHRSGDAHAWELKTGQKLWSFADRFRSCCGQPAFTSDGKLVGVPAGGFGAVVCDSTTGVPKAKRVAVTGSNGMTIVGFSRDGKRCLVAGDDGPDAVDAAAHVFELGTSDRRSMDEIAKFAPNCSIARAAISSDGLTVALVEPWRPESTGVWDVASGRKLLTFALKNGVRSGDRSDPAKFLSFEPRGARLAVGYKEKVAGRDRSFTLILSAR